VIGRVKLISREALSRPNPLYPLDGPTIETLQSPHLRSGEPKAPVAPCRGNRNWNWQRWPPKRDALSNGIETESQKQRDGDHKRSRSCQMLHTDVRQTSLQSMQFAFVLDQYLVSSHATIIR
jgi:hypothetical protein